MYPIFINGDISFSSSDVTSLRGILLLLTVIWLAQKVKRAAFILYHAREGGLKVYFWRSVFDVESSWFSMYLLNLFIPIIYAVLAIFFFGSFVGNLLNL